MMDRPKDLLRIFLAIVMLLLGIIIALLSTGNTSTIGVLAQNVGLALVVAGLIATFQEVIWVPLRRNEIREGFERVSAETKQGFNTISGLVSKTLDLGITDVWRERRSIPPGMWNEFTKDARQEVWLFGVAESGFANDDDFWEILGDGAARGCNYKILLLNPDSPYFRDWDEKDKHDNSKIIAANRIFRQLVEQHRGKSGKVEFRVYNEVPTLSIVRADGEMLVTFYMSSVRGDYSPTLRIQNKPNGLFVQYMKQFNRVWNVAIPVMVAELKKEPT